METSMSKMVKVEKDGATFVMNSKAFSLSASPL